MTKKTTKTAKKAARKTAYSKAQFDFVYDRLLDWKKEDDNGYWTRQSRTIQKLFKTYGVDFWPYVNIGTKVRSLEWFTHGEGKKLLDEAYDKFLRIQTPEKEIDKTEVVSYDRVTTAKKTVIDGLFE